MIRNKILILMLALLIISQMSTTASAATSSAPANQYYVATTGNDSHAGTEDAPWQTVKKAVKSAMPGDTIYLRGGQYEGLKGGWVFSNSGSETEPITLTNYPGEQAVLKITAAVEIDRNLFRCSQNPSQPASWQTPKADHIRIIGSDVLQRTLPNGVKSHKGIVMLGMEGEQSSAIIASDCDHWEVAGVDFIEVAYGIFTHKNNWHLPEEHSTDHWYVHDNRVYNYYRESGLQFDGNYNLIENNEIYKVSDRLDTPYGCQMLNLLGNNNIVRGNTLSRMGSNAECSGILFEWDISDANLIEYNTITDVIVGVSFQGGDSNLIQNNVIIAASNTTKPGVLAGSYNSQRTWPCDDYVNSGSSAEALLPPDDPLHPDYPYYYNPRNCHSMNNLIRNNLILGFNMPWYMYPVQESSNVFANNSTLGVTYILRVDPTPASSESVINFNVIFSTDVTGVDQNDFNLITTELNGAYITGVNPVSASVYTVSAYTGNGGGSIRLDVSEGASINDLSGTSLSGLPFENGEVYTVTRTMSRIIFPSKGAQDGWVRESTETSEIGGTMDATSTVLIIGDDASNQQYRAILRFDTSTLPDNAVITSLILKLKQQGNVVGTSPFSALSSLQVDMHKPAFGNAILELTDFNSAAKKVRSAVFNPNPVNGWFTARFNNGGKLYVNRIGATQLRLYFSVDDNDNNIADLIRFFSGNAAAGDRPKLLITYYVP